MPGNPEQLIENLKMDKGLLSISVFEKSECF